MTCYCFSVVAMNDSPQIKCLNPPPPIVTDKNKKKKQKKKAKKQEQKSSSQNVQTSNLNSVTTEKIDTSKENVKTENTSINTGKESSKKVDLPEKLEQLKVSEPTGTLIKKAATEETPETR